MGAEGWISVVGIALTTIGGLIATLYTQKRAKEQNAVTGYTALTQDQRTELNRLFQRVEDLETNEAERRRLAHEHERWDRQAAAKIRELSQDPFPDPPPLDTWERRQTP